jgi:hypothetical protein
MNFEPKGGMSAMKIGRQERLCPFGLGLQCDMVAEMFEAALEVGYGPAPAEGPIGHRQTAMGRARTRYQIGNLSRGNFQAPVWNGQPLKRRDADFRRWIGDGR